MTHNLVLNYGMLENMQVYVSSARRASNGMLTITPPLLLLLTRTSNSAQSALPNPSSPASTPTNTSTSSNKSSPKPPKN